jgi:RNA polymerase sigma-70 factor, ECF subfamily
VLTAIREKEQTAVMESWFEEYHAMVLNAAYRITGSREDAEDVLQTIFTRLLANPRVLDPVENIQGYFYRSAVNGALDLLRRRHGIQFSEADEEFEMDTLPALGGNPFQQLQDKELEGWLRKTLLKVSPLSAEAFILSRLEGLDHQEIASLLETTPNSIAVLLHRVRAKLVKELHEYLGGQS